MSVPSEVYEGSVRSCKAVECTDLTTSHCNGGMMRSGGGMRGGGGERMKTKGGRAVVRGRKEVREGDVREGDVRGEVRKIGKREGEEG